MIRIAGPIGPQDITSIAKAAALDDKLSYAARGLLLDLMSRPEDFLASADILSRAARAARGDTLGEGRRAMRALFAELERAGYIRWGRSRTASGEFFTAITVTDLPGHEETAEVSQPAAPSRLETDQSGIVYVIGDGRSNVVKIGITKNLRSRLKGMQVSYPYELRVLCSFPGSVGLEAHLHRRFHGLRTQGEWFDFAGVDAVAVISQAAANFEVTE
jgi:hypothetical protein